MNINLLSGCQERLSSLVEELKLPLMKSGKALLTGNGDTFLINNQCHRALTVTFKFYFITKQKP